METSFHYSHSRPLAAILIFFQNNSPQSEQLEKLEKLEILERDIGVVDFRKSAYFFATSTWFMYRYIYGRHWNEYSG